MGLSGTGMRTHMAPTHLQEFGQAAVHQLVTVTGHEHIAAAHNFGDVRPMWRSFMTSEQHGEFPFSMFPALERIRSTVFRNALPRAARWNFKGANEQGARWESPASVTGPGLSAASGQRWFERATWPPSHTGAHVRAVHTSPRGIHPGAGHLVGVIRRSARPPRWRQARFPSNDRLARRFPRPSAGMERMDMRGNRRSGGC